jgi:hypothetical protein
VEDCNLSKSQFIFHVGGSRLSLRAICKDDAVEHLGSQGSQGRIGCGRRHHGDAGFFINRNRGFGFTREYVPGNRDDGRIRDKFVGNRSANFS